MRLFYTPESVRRIYAPDQQQRKKNRHARAGFILLQRIFLRAQAPLMLTAWTAPLIHFGLRMRMRLTAFFIVKNNPFAVFIDII